MKDTLALLVVTMQTVANSFPKRWSKDADNIYEFGIEVSRKGKDLMDADDYAAFAELVLDMARVVYTGVWGLRSCAPWKASLSWLTGFDPFKAFRLEADVVARKHGLAWRRK